MINVIRQRNEARDEVERLQEELKCASYNVNRLASEETELRGLWEADRKRLARAVDALRDARSSLRSISMTARADSPLLDLDDVRQYAASRADCVDRAIAQIEKGQDDAAQ